MNRDEAISRRLEATHEETNPNGGTACWVIGKSRPWITINGEQILLARYILNIEDAGTKVIAMHTCDNPPCVSPEHLVQGNQSTNIADWHARAKSK